MLKIRWKDVLERIREKERQFYKEIVRQKLAFTGHVLRGRSSRNTLEILEGKIKGKKAQGRLKRMWFNDIRQWTMLTDNGKVKRSPEDRVGWRAITCQPST